MTGCTISTNTATSGPGGGIYCGASIAALTNCTISGNTACYGSSEARGSGGGLYCDGSSPVLTNCVIRGNAAVGYYGCGGGVCCYYSSPTLANCTITGNTAYAGGGLCCHLSYVATLTNCILWADTPQEIYPTWSSAAVTYCNIQGGWPGTGNIDSEPVFALADDLHLMPGSPCIDSGTNSPPGGLPPADIEGMPRPLDGDGDGQAIADMGAYEFNAAAPCIALSPSTFDLYAYAAGPNPPPQVLSIRNSGSGILTWQVGSNRPWMNASPSSGSCQQEVDSVALSVDTTGLVVGNYSCTITVSDPAATNNPRLVPVTLHLGAARHVPSEYSTIRAAINAAAQHDWVLVADGVYKGWGNKELGYGGKAVILASESGNAAACIIDCENSGRAFYFQTWETAAARVDGFTIRGASSSGIYCTRSSPTIVNCIITGNAASSGGGVSCNQSSCPALTNCLVVGNTASSNGGGVYCNGSWPRLTNCTISGNNASGPGGGLYCSSSSPNVTNCILWGDTPQEIYVSGDTPLVTYSDVQGGHTGTGNLNANPLFVDPANGDYHLAANSPCIDAGDPASDFRLEPEPDGGRINMGAYGNTPEAECKAWLRIEGYGLVSQTRVGRTVFDYQINMRLKNASTTGVTDVVAELLSMPPNVTIIDGQVSFGAVPAGATVTSVDTFTIRVDRSVPISALPISWRITYSRSGHTEQRVLVGGLDFDTQPAPHPVPIEPSAVPADTPGVATPGPLHRGG